MSKNDTELTPSGGSISSNLWEMDDTSRRLFAHASNYAWVPGASLTTGSVEPDFKPGDRAELWEVLERLIES